MGTRNLGLASLVTLIVTATAWAGSPVNSADVQDMTAKIDYWTAAAWTARHIQPAPRADDAEFLRRVSLDLIGRIPSVADVRAFLSDRSPDKRQRAVERLLASPQYAIHFANVWRELLLPHTRFNDPQLEDWLRKRIDKNEPYDRMVRELLTVAADEPGNDQGNGNAGAFFQAEQFKPENLAASTSRVFLGVKVECAQCHNHPFAAWKRQQFWEYAAFFSDLAPNPNTPKKKHLAPSLQIPGTDRIVEARFLDGKRPRWQKKPQPRKLLAGWMTASDNPYFARAEVNRLWAHFLGRGLVEPVDDLSAGARPSHPELFAELSQNFVTHGYDVKFFIRAITASRAYQLTSTVTQPGQDQPDLFACMPLRGLTAEQLFDSLVQVTGYREPLQTPRRFFFSRRQSARQEFLERFASNDRPIKVQSSILQALTLMNGKLVADATSLQRSETLRAVLEAPFLDTLEKKIEALFLAALSRPPRPAEIHRFATYAQRAGKAKEQRALADIFWALLNSSEFLLNH